MQRYFNIFRPSQFNSHYILYHLDNWQSFAHNYLHELMSPITSAVQEEEAHCELNY